jgi:predicted acylesterase/phospholipase RssA
MKYSASSGRVGEDTINLKKDGLRNTMSSSSSDKSEAIENVLILQGGGSLGAFGCGVFKALSQKDVKINIVAGTSIGGVNAAIIAGSKNK